MQIEWKLVAIKQIKKIPNPDKQRIFTQVESLEDGLEEKTNIKKLINHQFDYRLRVGNYRVLFNVHECIQIISIEEVKKRDERTY